jgi:uncharacterized protein YehS (DUF1456 family)
MSNNDVMKKLRVALSLNSDQIIEICKLVGFTVTKSELGDIFRNDEHPNFKKCGDQILRNFLNGLVTNADQEKRRKHNKYYRHFDGRRNLYGDYC